VETAESTVELTDDRDSVARCRRWLNARLAGEPAELRERVVLCASEVTTNAVLHARSSITVSLSMRPGTVRVEVHDESRVLPLLRNLGHEATMGRGLIILDSLASSWGVDVSADGLGKVVWFEVAESSPPSDTVRALMDDLPVADSTRPRESAGRTVLLIGTPLDVAGRAWQEYAAVMGELRLLDRNSESTRRLFALLEAAESWAPNLRVFSLIEERIAAAHDESTKAVDLEVPANEHTGEAARYLDEFLDAMEALYELDPVPLLSPRPTASSRALRKWLLGEFIRQGSGGEARRWPGPD
jgi:anti-sigma regulatory factor (Ser/Thr protein kinase)